MEKTTLYLPEQLQRSLAALSRREKRSQAEIIREALDSYISSRSAVRPSSLASGSDDEVSGATSEAWLRENWNESKPRKRKSTK